MQILSTETGIEVTESLAANPINVDELRDPELVREVRTLRDADNFRNWYYIAREYLYFAIVLVPTLWFYHIWEPWGLSWWWNVPVSLAAILLVGIIQHRLVMLGHEASHYILFRNQKLNDIAANWFCFYPLWSMCYNYRLQHLAHHQYTNDLERDPDLIYMEASGQRFHYPMPLGKFFWDCVIRLFFWIPGLVNYVIIRAKFANLGGITGPYMPQEKPSKLVPAIHTTYMVTMIAFVIYASLTDNLLLLTWGPLVLLGIQLGITLTIPGRYYMQTKVKPVISPRWATYQRLVYFTLLFFGMAWLRYFTGHPWLMYYVLLWVVPLFTTWSFCMILREDIQHSNTPQGKFVDTRDFQGNLLVKWILFPLNMDLHLPHHLFPMVPHYNLPKLNALLQRTEVYRQNRIVVLGYLFPPTAAPHGV